MSPVNQAMILSAATKVHLFEQTQASRNCEEFFPY